MIRNVVLGRIAADVAADADSALRRQLDQGLAGIAGLLLPGQLSMHVGPDRGLREGSWSFAITNDWVDEDAYRAYDLDEEHNRYRRMIVEALSDVARVQFEIAD